MSSGRLLGAHMPTSGGLHKSLTGGLEIGCNAVQLFTCSPRQWNHPPLTDAAIEAFNEATASTGITSLIAHDSYLINLAAPSAENLEKSRKAFRVELDRANALGIQWLVTHMGAHVNEGEDAAYERLIESMAMILKETDELGYTVGVAMETTAGQGTGLGWQFEQLGRVLKGVGDNDRLGVCLDTCHIFVAGYDIRTPETYADTWLKFDTEIGKSKLKVLHLNDAKKPLGSRVDRHEHIGEGQIGYEAFRRIVTDPTLAHVPCILETPETETMHEVNLNRLKSLAAGEKL